MKTYPSSPVADAYLSQKKFDFAVKLAGLAVEIDEFFDTPDFSISFCVDLLHDIAKDLAGDRAGEIYDLTEEVEA